MPTFHDLEVEVETDAGKERLSTDVDFEVFCSCGFGLCPQSSTRRSRNRRFPQVEVEPCGRCLHRAAEKCGEEVREELEARIAELEARIAELEAEKEVEWKQSNTSASSS